ncbi:hypothetical protein JCM16303_003644 [Sporobolomyces ruberrimus]
MAKNTTSKPHSSPSKSKPKSSHGAQAYRDFYAEQAAKIRAARPGTKGATIRRKVKALWTRKKEEDSGH